MPLSTSDYVLIGVFLFCWILSGAMVIKSENNVFWTVFWFFLFLLFTVAFLIVTILIIFKGV